MNTQTVLVKNLRDRIDRILLLGARFPLWPEVLSMDVRLRMAIQKLESSEAGGRPMVLALLGGTGVGKSHLFNALLGLAEASPVSHTIRPCTAKPKLAVSPKDIASLRMVLDLNDVDVVEAPLSGVVLIDCPDIDSLEIANREKTRRILAMADVVVLVSDPAKRSNFVIHQEVSEWKERKRWYFVLTKADHVRQEMDAVRLDFDKHLCSHGFRPTSSTRFLVSCLEPHDFEFGRFRNTLLGERSEALRALLPLDGFLGQVCHALESKCVEGIGKNHQLLQEGEARIESAIQLAYLEALGQQDCADAMKALLREQIWQLAQDRVGILMAIPVWIRNRLSALALSWSLGQMFMGRASLVGILGIGLGSLVSLLKGQAPYRKVLGALGTKFRMRMLELRGDAKKVLEDAKVPVATEPVQEEKLEPAPGMKNWGLFGVGAGIETAIRALLKQQPEDEVVELLKADLDRLAAKAGREIFGPLTILLVNLLPLVAVGDILYRVGKAWMEGNYLPWNFYSMAALVFLASLLPGYLILSRKIWNSAMLPDLREIVRNIHGTSVTSQLRTAREESREILENIKILEKQVGQVRSSLAHEMDVPEFGERVHSMG
jgi:energy-coupling factor transporter ATP-binding protein EcfA2